MVSCGQSLHNALHFLGVGILLIQCHSGRMNSRMNACYPQQSFKCGGFSPSLQPGIWRTLMQSISGSTATYVFLEAPASKLLFVEVFRSPYTNSIVAIEWLTSVGSSWSMNMNHRTGPTDDWDQSISGGSSNSKQTILLSGRLLHPITTFWHEHTKPKTNHLLSTCQHPSSTRRHVGDYSLSFTV